MPDYLAGMAFADALKAQGLIPPDCLDVTVTIPAVGVVQLHYTVNMTGATAAKVARVFAHVALAAIRKAP